MSMSFRVTMFSHNAKAHLRNATGYLGNQFDLMGTPYYSANYHLSAVAYPFCHLAKSLFSLCRIGQGALLLVGSLFNDPIHNVPAVIGGIGREVLSLAMNLINTVVSAITFVTRTLMTMLCLGYTENKLEAAYQASGRGMAGGLMFGLASAGAQLAEQQVRENSFNLSA